MTKPRITAVKADGHVLTWAGGMSVLPGDGGYCCVIPNMPCTYDTFAWAGNDTYPVISRGGHTAIEAIRWGVRYVA